MTQIIHIPDDVIEHLSVGMTVISKGKDREGAFIVLDSGDRFAEVSFKGAEKPKPSPKKTQAEMAQWNRETIKKEFFYQLNRVYPEKSITMTTALFLGTSELDSLDKVEVVMNLEDAFDIEIPDEDACGKMGTVGDALEYLCKKMI